MVGFGWASVMDQMTALHARLAPRLVPPSGWPRVAGSHVGLADRNGVLVHGAGAVELIAHDLTATLGWDHARAQAGACDALDNRMQFLLDDLAGEQLDPATRQEVLEDLVVEAVEDLQQRLHDTFVDTTWPACPRHRRHPRGLGKTTVAGPRGAARAMMRRSPPLGALPARPADPRS